MDRKNLFSNKEMNKYLFILILVILAYMSYLLIKPYLITIITAMITTLVFYPVYKRINKKINRSSVSSALTIVIILAILVIPSIFITQSIANETYGFYRSVESYLDDEELFPEECSSSWCTLLSQVKEYINIFKDEQTFKESLKSFGSIAKDYSLTYGKGLLVVLGNFVIKFFVFLFVLYYLFIEGENFIDYVKKTLPIDKKYQKELVEKAKNTLYAVLYGNFLTGFIQTLFAVILYYILGVPSPLFFGLITFIGAITIGTWIAWAPVGVWMLLQGIFTSNNPLVVKAVILLVVGVVVISMMDNFVRPYLIKRMTDTNIVVILLGLLGGIKLFGFVGVFIGPVILALFLVAVRIYTEK